MKKLLIILLLIALSSLCYSMGEKPTKTDRGTPIFESADQQIQFTQEVFLAAKGNSHQENIKRAIDACYDYRKLFTQDLKNTAITYFFEAELYVLKKDYQKSTELIKKFKEADSTLILKDQHVRVQYLEGFILAQQKKYAEALEVYANAENTLPSTNHTVVEIKKGMAEIYQATNKIEESIAAYIDSTEYPCSNLYDKATSHLKAAFLLKKLGKNDEAKAQFQKIIALPESSETKGPKTAARIALHEM